MQKDILDNFILVQSDLFTPLTRTPWAGSKISENYKNHSSSRSLKLRLVNLGNFLVILSLVLKLKEQIIPLTIYLKNS